MTVAEAIRFFDADPMGRRAAEKLRVLNDVGIREVTAGWGPDAIKAAMRAMGI